MTNLMFAIAAIVFAPFIGGLISGSDRILTARLQGRIGPPMVQPFYDVIKLFGKEKMVVNVWQAFCAYSYLVSAAIAVGLFFYQTDLLLILFVEAVGAIFLVVGALSSTSPYSQVGAHRELLQILSYEPLLVFVVVGIYLETGSFKIASVWQWQEPLLIKLPFMFVVLGYALTIKLRKSPFDLSSSHHAHQEIVRGVLTDFSGPTLALIEIGHFYEIVLLMGFCAMFWSTSWLGVLVLLVLTYAAEILIDNVSARMNWRWMLGYVWSMGFTLSLVNLVWLKFR